MATLHVVSHSSFTDGRLKSCLKVLGATDGLLLCGDAVHALQTGSTAWLPLLEVAQSGRLYALDEDVSARAIYASEQVQRLDYAGFVQLSIDFDKVNNWL
ncbi:sulfurtransferase complex subunit TusB [Pseudomonas baltica]|uniref:sulfurtransferase complex subunit TusB n=1 Tax=Pseudomonas baltica TaxID=2762576 RepID=UPI00289FF631|nr:sulfurtransferase complex subunit TusB [Pseudomonas baltica]